MRRRPYRGISGFKVFSLVSSETPLAPRFATNYVRLVNASTSVLTDVAFGLKENWSCVPLLTSIPAITQGATSPVVAVWQEIVMAGVVQADSVPIAHWPGPVQDGWYISYEQNGSNRMVEVEVISFGSSEKNISVIVSNSSMSLSAEWFEIARTWSY